MQLRRLNPRKGPGPDGILPKMIKLCAYQLAPVLTGIFNCSIQQGEVPSIWKTAEIRPLPKVSKPKQLKDYRPIALTSCLCKSLERLIKSYITTNTVSDALQFAYKSHRSTQDAVLQLASYVTKFIDARAGNHSRCLFLDFSSAFNTICVAKLVEKLTHLDPNVTSWISSFLTDRTQYTKFDSDCSRRMTTNTGTPQGTVLSPLLFSIYTDFITSATSNVTVLKYADDTVIIGNIQSDSDFMLYQEEVNRICILCNNSDLLLNPTKTHEMIFTTSRDPPVFPQVFIDNCAIETTDDVLYLGVHIDSKLRFSKQATSVESKCRQRMYILKRFAFYGASEQLLCQLFRSFIESCLLYCLPVYFNNLFDYDKKALRKIYPIANSYGALVGTLDNRISERFKRYCMLLLHDDDHPFHDFISKLPSGRLCAYKSRCACGSNSFIRHYINFINTVIAGS